METCLLGLETKTFLHASGTWHPVIPSVHFYAGVMSSLGAFSCAQTELWMYSCLGPRGGWGSAVCIGRDRAWKPRLGFVCAGGGSEIEGQGWLLLFGRVRHKILNLNLAFQVVMKVYLS